MAPSSLAWLPLKTWLVWRSCAPTRLVLRCNHMEGQIRHGCLYSAENHGFEAFSIILDVWHFQWRAAWISSVLIFRGRSIRAI